MASPVSVHVALAPGVVYLQQALWRSERAVRLTDAALVEKLTAGVDLAHLPALTTSMPGRTIDEVLVALQRWRLLSWRLMDSDGSVLAEAQPTRDDVPLPVFASTGPASTGTPDVPEPASLALLRPHGDGWAWEPATGEWCVLLGDPGLARLAARDPQLLRFAAAVGLAGDVPPSVAAWEFHDLVFAARSRRDAGGGGTYPWADTMPAPEPEAPYPGGDGERVVLPPVPPIPHDPGFLDVLRHRRSVREFTPDLDLAELASVLGLTLGRTGTRERDPADAHSYTALRTPVPSAGGTHAIETWVVSSGVAGLPDGAWWYDASDHSLVRVPGAEWESPLPYGAPVLLIHAYRHARLAWKYSAIAHALALKDAGALMQTVHLTTGALGLGSVILGSGLTHHLCRALAIDPWEFMPVGELVLGRPAG